VKYKNATSGSFVGLNHLGDMCKNPPLLVPEMRPGSEKRGASSKYFVVELNKNPEVNEDKN
jgi:hypothetical protein